MIVLLPIIHSFARRKMVLRIEPKNDNNLRQNKVASGEIDRRPHKYWLSVEF